jgi:hypothetical protein
VGGTVSGLSGTGLVLQNNGGNNLSISANGSFTLSSSVSSGSSYSVTVLTQPSSPSQTCTVSNGSGNVGNTNVTSIGITCTTIGYTVGGSISGLRNGESITLQNNGGDNLTISVNGSFSFATPLATGTNYNVSVLTPPLGRDCSIVAGFGTISSANITSVDVLCTDPLILTVSQSPAAATITWNNTDANSYDLYRSTDANCNFNYIGSCANGTVSNGVTSPQDATGLTNGVMYYFVLKGNHSGGHVRTSARASARPDSLTSNGDVFALSIANDGTTYIGGNFTALGARTGGGVPFSTVNNSIAGNFPPVGGTVYAVAPDGSGGWYIGGNFSSVAGQPRKNIAHILPNGNLDTVNWTFSTDGSVTSIVTYEGTVYIAGGFIRLGGIPYNVNSSVVRSHVAAFDTTGSLLPWAPVVGNAVSKLLISGNTLLVGGAFITVDSQSRSKLAAFNLTTGALMSWAPNVTGSYVFDLAVSGSTVYVAGRFSAINGAARSNLAAVNLTTGSLETWVQNTDNDVRNIAVSGGHLFVGGVFTLVNGISRNHLAAFDLVTGMLSEWNPITDIDDDVNVLLVSGNRVFVGGAFTKINGVTRQFLASIDSSTGVLDEWTPYANASWVPSYWESGVVALAVSGSTVYAGALNQFINGATRTNLAAVDGNGVLTAWAPSTNNPVKAITIGNGTIYVGGSFTQIGSNPFDVNASETRKYIAAFDSTGALLPWAPSANNNVNALAYFGSTIYMGGDFTTINSTTRNYLAAVNTSGSLVSWAPSANGRVNALAATPSRIYAGGAFTSIGATTSNYLVGIDNFTGTVFYAGNATAQVYALAAQGYTVYAGGDFTWVDGLSRQRLASINDGYAGAVSASLTTWAPSANDSVYAISASSTSVYVGGKFSSVNASPRNSMASLSTSGVLNNWGNWQPSSVSTEVFIYALSANSSDVYVGGDFISINNAPANGLARLPP